MSCRIAEHGVMCEDCGHLIMEHSLCPVQERAAAEAIALARASAKGMIGALLAGRWPSGDRVGTVERFTLRRFDGEYVEGMEPVEVLQVKVVNGQLVEDKEG